MCTHVCASVVFCTSTIFHMLPTPFLFLTFFHSRLFLSLSKRCLVVILRVRFSMYRNLRNRSTIPALFAQMVTKHPDKPALIYEATGEVRTRQINSRTLITVILLSKLTVLPYPFYSRFGVSGSCRSDATPWLTGRWHRDGLREMWWPCTWRAGLKWWLCGWGWLWSV